MRTTTFFLILVSLFAGPAAAQFPDTPPGRQLSGWLDAFNSGDRATLQAFLDKSIPGRPADQGLAMRAQTGGFDFKKVEESSDTRVIALLQERGPAKGFVRHEDIPFEAVTANRFGRIFAEGSQSGKLAA